jgi:hypothetical protein
LGDTLGIKRSSCTGEDETSQPAWNKTTKKYTNFNISRKKTKMNFAVLVIFHKVEKQVAVGYK